MSDHQDNELFGIETEYVAMRAEILERVKLRHQIIGFTVVFGGAFLGVGIEKPIVAMLYAPLAGFLSLACAQNEWRIKDLAAYIRDSLCPKVPAFGWELYMKEHRSDSTLSSWRNIVLSYGGLFVFTMLLSICVGWPGVWKMKHAFDWTEFGMVTVLCVVDVVAVIFPFFILWKSMKERNNTF